MSDSLSKFNESKAQDELEKNHLNMKKKFKGSEPEEIDFKKVLQQSPIYKEMGERPSKEKLGPFEQSLHNQFLLMDEIQKLKLYVGLKPERIKLEEARLYYPEMPSPITIRNYRCQGKSIPYIESINRNLWVNTKKYETYRKAKLAI